MWLRVEGVRESFIDTAPGGKARLEALEQIVENVYTLEGVKQARKY